MRPTGTSRLGLLLALFIFWPFGAAAQEPDVVDTIPSENLMLGRTPFAVQGFADWNYAAVAPAGEHSSFYNGALDLFITSRLSDRWSVLAEIVLESLSSEFSADLERLQVTYEQSDALRVSIGRVHSPILRWAVTNHHGQFMQTPVDNPIIARWEDQPGAWPLHFVGLLAAGRVPGALGLSYAAGVGNGRGPTLDQVQVKNDANGAKAWVFSVGVAPDSVPGLRLFGSGYLDRIPAPGLEIRERDVTGSVEYLRGPVELKAEWSLLHHTPETGDAVWNTRGWYVLASYRLDGALRRLRPYVLVEAQNVAEGEAYLEGVQDEKAVAGGLRVDVSRWIALKGEFRSQSIGSGSRDGVVQFQIAANF